MVGPTMGRVSTDIAGAIGAAELEEAIELEKTIGLAAGLLAERGTVGVENGAGVID